MKGLETKMKQEAKSKNLTIEVLDKTELRQLSAGAEDTSSSEDDCDDESEEALERRKQRMQKRNISTAMQRCIDRILKSSIESEDKSEEGKIISDDGKIRFNRL